MPFWLDRLEEKYEHLGWTLPELHHAPIEAFRAHCAATAEIEEGRIGATLDLLDGRGVMWSSDPPHFDCEDGGSPRRLKDSEALPLVHRERILRALRAAPAPGAATAGTSASGFPGPIQMVAPPAATAPNGQDRPSATSSRQPPPNSPDIWPTRRAGGQSCAADRMSASLLRPVVCG